VGSRLFYFSLTVGSGATAWYALARGLSPSVAVFGMLALTACVLLVTERVRPYRHAWLQSHDDVQTDVLHLTVSVGLALGGRWFFAVAFAHTNVTMPPALWPAEWPTLAQIGLALALGDFCSYWIHRTQHQLPILWRFHAIHHSAPRLYWLNQMRNHPVDAMLSGMSLFPLILLGAPEDILTISVIVTNTHLMLQHANIHVRLGSLNWILSMAEVHRWHHSREPDESNANYGGVFLVWDVLFGTRRVSVEREPPTETGLTDHKGFPQDYLGQLAAPFRARSK
jgi:sterol desaturase/sphingolipid hydroxylase (fatty acid hydroxylase superfamily)